MKMTKHTVASLVSRIMAAALVLAGFGCSSDDDDMVCMYGTPTGTFEVKGSVTADNDAPASPAGVKVVVTAPDMPSSHIYNYGEEETTVGGRYSINGETSGGKLKVVCLPDDPDLEPDSVVVEAKFAKASTKRDYWMDLGHADINVDFKLKEKKTGE